MEDHFDNFATYVVHKLDMENEKCDNLEVARARFYIRDLFWGIMGGSGDRKSHICKSLFTTASNVESIRRVMEAYWAMQTLNILRGYDLA